MKNVRPSPAMGMCQPASEVTQPHLRSLETWPEGQQFRPRPRRWSSRRAARGRQAGNRATAPAPARRPERGAPASRSHPTSHPISARRATVRRRADADDGRGRRVVKVSGSLLAARLASPFARLRNVAGGNGEQGGGRARRGRDEGGRESAEKSKLSSSAPALGQAIAADRATSLRNALDGEIGACSVARERSRRSRCSYTRSLQNAISRRTNESGGHADNAAARVPTLFILVV